MRAEEHAEESMLDNLISDAIGDVGADPRSDRALRKKLRWLRRRREVEAIRVVLAADQSTHALNTSALAERLYMRGMRVRGAK